MRTLPARSADLPAPTPRDARDARDAARDAAWGGAWGDAPFWAGVALALLVVLALRTMYFAMGDVADGRLGTLPRRLFEEATGTAAALPLVPAAVLMARRAVLRRDDPRPWLAHALTFAAGTVLHTALIYLLRTALAPALGFGLYEYGSLARRILQEAPNDLIAYVVIVAARRGVDGRRVARAREREALALERELARSRLENLHAQLQPHFLFNALNTIASTMYTDVRAADEMIGHLSDLLRGALGSAGRAEVPLEEELLLLERYLALTRARFGDALALTLRVDASARALAVPPLLLQPLVENAVRHGIGPAGYGRVTVRVAREEREGDAVLVLSVENPVERADESLAVTPATSGGVGLGVTARRLALLYRGAAHLEAGRTPDGTFRVTIRIPAAPSRAAVRTEGGHARSARG